MSRTTLHVHLDVTDALTRWPDRDLRILFRHTGGRRLSACEARAVLAEELARGRRVLPFGPPCPGFDFAGGGCPGHQVEESTQTSPCSTAGGGTDPGGLGLGPG